MKSTSQPSMKTRVQRRNPQDISAQLRSSVESLIENLDLLDVEEVSKVAATFFAWVSLITRFVTDK